MKLLLLMVKNLRRNKLRLTLTSLAIVFLVAIFTMIQSVLTFLDEQMTEKTENIKLLITEKYRIPSRFRLGDWGQIVNGGQAHDRLLPVPGFDPQKQTIWHFIVFSLDPDMKDRKQMFFVISTLPDKLATMVDGLEEMYDPRWVQWMADPPVTRIAQIGVVMGDVRAERLGKKVGDTFTAKSLSHRDKARQPIEMQFEIVGILPKGSRWPEAAFVDHAYLERTLDEKGCELAGMVNLGWLTVKDQAAANQVIKIIEEELPDLKCETAATAISRFFEPLKDILNGVKYVLAPVIVVVIIVIIANAISITVRERTKEIAVMKVLGFSRARILLLVLGEGVLIGGAAGLLAAALTHGLVNLVFGGIPLQLGFFPRFLVPLAAYWWGPALGASTAVLGSLGPAWSACSVKVSEVFAKVA